MIAAAFEEFDLDYATAMAERANRLMVQHGVAPTPNNFAVWFNYSCDTGPELKRTIDILIAGKRRFDPATNRELFSTYLAAGPASATDSNVPEQLKSVMAAAQRFVAQAIADNHTQIRAIGDVAERAESGIDPRL
jgi:diguanylate cyclase